MLRNNLALELLEQRTVLNADFAHLATDATMESDAAFAVCYDGTAEVDLSAHADANVEANVAADDHSLDVAAEVSGNFTIDLHEDGLTLSLTEVNFGGSIDWEESLSQLNVMLTSFLNGETQITAEHTDEGLSVHVTANANASAEGDEHLAALASGDLSVDGSVEATADVSAATTAAEVGADLSVDTNVDLSSHVDSDSSHSSADVAADASVGLDAAGVVAVDDATIDAAADVQVPVEFTSENLTLSADSRVSGDGAVSTDDLTVDANAELTADGVFDFDPTIAIPGNSTSGLVDVTDVGVADSGLGDPGRYALGDFTTTNLSTLQFSDPSLLNNTFNHVNFDGSFSSGRATVEDSLDAAAVDDFFQNFGLLGSPSLTPSFL
jgi:hypothetical protein